jgi:hypothetical protein
VHAESIESADRYTAGHCDRVADYACRLAALAGDESKRRVGPPAVRSDMAGASPAVRSGLVGSFGSRLDYLEVMSCKEATQGL